MAAAAPPRFVTRGHVKQLPAVILLVIQPLANLVKAMLALALAAAQHLVVIVEFAAAFVMESLVLPDNIVLTDPAFPMAAEAEAILVTM